MPQNSTPVGANLHLIRLGEAIVDQLIASAERAQPHWRVLFKGRDAEIQQLSHQAQQGASIWNHPLFLEYLMIWTASFDWPTVEGFSDGVRLGAPDHLVSPLTQLGVIESFDFFMMDRSECCMATLASNDHDAKYALMFNAAAWLQLASMPQFFDSFSQQIRMVVHHEMAHVRYKKAGLREEQIAHCRGIASLIAIAQFPATVGDLLALLDHDFPYVLKNGECLDLLRSRPNSAFRLIRIWSRLIELASEIVQ